MRAELLHERLRSTVTTPLPVSMPSPVLFSSTLTSCWCAKAVALIKICWTRALAEQEVDRVGRGLAKSCRDRACERLQVVRELLLELTGHVDVVVELVDDVDRQRATDFRSRTSCALAFLNESLLSIWRLTQIVRIVISPISVATTISDHTAMLRPRVSVPCGSAAGGAGRAARFAVPRFDPLGSRGTPDSGVCIPSGRCGRRTPPSRARRREAAAATRRGAPGSPCTSASTGMKFVSPLQRGTTCRWPWSTMPAPAMRPTFQPRL